MAPMPDYPAYRRYLLILAAGLLWSLPVDLAATEHYYLDIDRERIAVGIYAQGTRHKKELWGGSPDQTDAAVLADILAGPADTLLLYFHSFLGSQPQYHRRVLRSFDRLEGITRTVTVSWHTGTLSYVAAWKRASGLGATIAPVLYHLAAAGRVVHVLCHSMGNRVFEGVLAVPAYCEDMRFGSVLLAAADLDTDILTGAMNRLPRLCRQIVVYTHRRDLMLLTAAAIWKRPRLGRGLPAGYTSPEDCATVEVVDIGTGFRSVLSDPSGHVYFLMNRTVRRDIARVLAGDEEGRRPYLDRVGDGFYRLR